MPISRDTVQALQKAGAAVHDAHAALDASAQKHSAQVAQAVNTNPFGLENDSLFNSWRTLAGVVQELHAMEQNLRALHATVASLSADNAVVVSDLSAVAASAPKATKAKARKADARLLTAEFAPC